MAMKRDELSRAINVGPLYEGLIQRFPHLFLRAEAALYWWPKGWHPLVVRACELLDQNSDRYWIQIKEKFGALRLYYSPYEEDITKKMYELEQESYSTCMRCSGPSKRISVEGYWCTYCPECLKELEIAV